MHIEGRERLGVHKSEICLVSLRNSKKARELENI